MSFLVCEELSPSQMGPATTRMSLARILGYISGQASDPQPCSRMSGQTPVAMSWSTNRISSTSTPCLRMIPALASTSPWVLLTSGLRFRVQLTKVAFRPEKSCSSIGLPLGSWLGRRTFRLLRASDRYALRVSSLCHIRGRNECDRPPDEPAGVAWLHQLEGTRTMRISALLGTAAVTVSSAVLALGGPAQ